MNASYTQEQKEWLKANYPIYGNACFKEFNSVFNTNKKKGTLREWCRRNGIYVKEEVTLKKKQERAKAMNPPRYHEVGDVWKENKSGYWVIKVADRGKVNNRSDSIKYYHRYIWERENSKIPKGYDVNFLDGNKDNCDIENLVCIPKSCEGLLNINSIRDESKEVMETAIKWCEFHMAIKEMEV